MVPCKLALFKRIIPSLNQTTIKYVKKRPDPGIALRKTIIPENDLDDNFEYDDVETDFMDVHKSHKQHMNELSAMKEREKYFIVKNKYFKQKFPNFLTWHDKEQIRYLHATDPDEWTVENLSESFPALPEIIKKIIKSDWTKNKQSKISNHDASVQRNWMDFKNGKLKDLPTELVEHLKKFTSRELNLNPFKIPIRNKNAIIEINKSNIGTEFSEIITSYEKIRKKSTDVTENEINVKEKIEEPPENDTYLPAGYVNNKKGNITTLKKLRSDLEEKSEKGEILDEDKLILANLIIDKNDQKIKNNAIEEIMDKKYAKSNNTGIGTYIKSERDLSHLKYAEKIAIPKNIFKKGYTYKLYDCYYDDDGEFLYRVPGME